MSTPKVSIIYVNYNTQDLLEDSLRSLVASKPKYSYEVIVEENGSKEFTADRIKKIFPEVVIVKSQANLGFGGGNNLGAKRAQGEYLWLLNTDTLIPEDNNFDKVLVWLEQHPEYAAAAPLLVNEHGKEQAAQVSRFPSIWRMVLEKPVGLLIRLLPVARKMFGWLDPRFVPIRSADVDQAVAAALLVRRSVFEKVGGFSKEYFFFYEDTDLCKKFASEGLKIRFVRDAKIIHLLGKSITSQYERKQRYYRAQDIYFRKWKSLPARVFVKTFRFPLVLWHRLKALGS